MTIDNNKASFKDYDIIRTPVMTEKSTKLFEQHGHYAFLVDIKASKNDVKRALESVFNVKVETINTLINKGKRKQKRRRICKRSDCKKAIIRLKDGYKIDYGLGV